jgi:hypothetical protein
MHRVAAELGDRAELRVEATGPGEEFLELMPRAQDAFGILVEQTLASHDEFWVTVVLGHRRGFGQEGDLDWLKLLVPAVVAGQVTVWEGSGRRRVAVRVGDKDVRHSTEYRRGCVPVPGWRRRARVTKSAPYT